MPSILSTEEWPTLVIKIVETGLLDERVEVRVKAGQVLSGLLHCEFISKEVKEKILVSILSSHLLLIIRVIKKLQWNLNRRYKVAFCSPTEKVLFSSKKKPIQKENILCACIV